MKLEPPPSRLFYTAMVSRCHSKVWCVGLGPAHPQVVANQNHLRSYSKALPGASRWMRQCIGPGVKRHGNPSITATPGRACRQSPLPEKKKKKKSLSEPLVNIHKVQKNIQNFPSLSLSGHESVKQSLLFLFLLLCLPFLSWLPPAAAPHGQGINPGQTDNSWLHSGRQMQILLFFRLDHLGNNQSSVLY